MHRMRFVSASRSSWESGSSDGRFRNRLAHDVKHDRKVAAARRRSATLESRRREDGVGGRAVRLSALVDGELLTNIQY